MKLLKGKSVFKGKSGQIINAAKAIPSAKGLPIIGTLFSLLKAGGGENLHRYIDNRHKELGPIFKESIGPVDAVFVSDPQTMRQIYAEEGRHPVHVLPEAWLLYNKKFNNKRGLYFMDGDEWLHYRRIMNKVFLTDYQDGIYERVHNSVIDDWISDWKQLIDMDITIDETQFYKLSLSYVVASLIGKNYLECKNEFSESIDSLSENVHSIFKESCKLNLIPAKLACGLNLPPWKKFVSAVSSGLKKGAMMVDKINYLASEDGLVIKLTQMNVPERVLKEIVIDLILAASDTTAFTTQWAIYLLSRHPETQKALKDNPSDSKLLKCIIKETLRLYPAAPFITRVLPKEIKLHGYTVKAGELLVMSLYTCGRDEKYFPEPEKFLPQRWERVSNEVNDGNLKDYRYVKDPNASQPFAMGLRSCVGRKLAESQMTLTLNKIGSNFWLESLQETDMHLHFVPVPKSPIKVHLSSII